jgi:5-methylcytosine-specific restriction endonuclease McrA
VAEYNGLYRKTHPVSAVEFQRRYRETHREQLRAAGRTYAAAHCEERRVYMLEYVAAHREERAEYYRHYSEAYPDVARAHSRNYRARKRSAVGSHTAADLRSQYCRQKGHCFYCKTRLGDSYHAEHVMPLVLGGSNGPENIVAACPTCNLSKNAKHPMDFAGLLF